MNGIPIQITIGITQKKINRFEPSNTFDLFARLEALSPSDSLSEEPPEPESADNTRYSHK